MDLFAFRTQPDDRKMRVLDFMEISDYLFLRTSRFLRKDIIVFNKKTHMTVLLDGNKLSNDVDGGMDLNVFYFYKMSDQAGILVNYVESVDLIPMYNPRKKNLAGSCKSNFSEIIGNLTIESNPVIMVMKLK